MKTWKLNILSSICFFFIVAMNLITKNYLSASIFTLLAVLHAYLSIINYRKVKKDNLEKTSIEQISKEDKYKLGVFYYNPDDQETIAL